MIAVMVLSNLLYVVGAIVAASVVSGLVLLRHRRPKSLEAGIEMFSRELKALEPERPSTAPQPAMPTRPSARNVSSGRGPGGSSGAGARGARGASGDSNSGVVHSSRVPRRPDPASAVRVAGAAGAARRGGAATTPVIPAPTTAPTAITTTPTGARDLGSGEARAPSADRENDSG